MVGSASSDLLIYLETAPNGNNASSKSVQLTTLSMRKNRMTNMEEGKKKEGKGIYFLHNYQHYFSSSIRCSLPLLKGVCGWLSGNETNINKLMLRQNNCINSNFGVCKVTVESGIIDDTLTFFQIEDICDNIKYIHLCYWNIHIYIYIERECVCVHTHEEKSKM